MECRRVWHKRWSLTLSGTDLISVSLIEFNDITVPYTSALCPRRLLHVEAKLVFNMTEQLPVIKKGLLNFKLY